MPVRASEIVACKSAAPALARVCQNVESASTAKEVRSALSEAEAIRDLLAKAMDTAGESAPDLAVLRREAEGVALNAALKLGALVPQPAEAGRGRNLPSVGTFSQECGLPRVTLQRYRALHEAFVAHPEHFGKIAEAAVSAGKSPPLGILRKLADEDVDPDTLLPGAEKPPKARPAWLAEAVKHALRAHDMCTEIANNKEAHSDVREAAKRYAEGVALFCGGLRRALNGESL